MKFFIGVTDNQWFDYLRRLKDSFPEGVDGYLIYKDSLSAAD